MDRRLQGTLAICVAVSTILTAFLVGERSRGITVLENRVPERIYGTRDTFIFNYGFVSRESFAVLDILYYTLRRTESKLEIDVNECSVEGLARLSPSINLLTQMAESLGVAPQLLKRDARLGDTDMTLMVLDFTALYGSFAPESVRRFPEGGRSGLMTRPNPTLCYAYLFDDSGVLTYTYEGTRDFFLDRGLVLADIHIRRNNETWSYASSRMAPQEEGRSIVDAPKFGLLSFEEVAKDERFEVGFSVNSRWLAAGMEIVQLMSVHGNGELLYAQANFIPKPSG